MPILDSIDRRLLSEFQRDLPLEPRPYAAMADRLGIGEAEVIARLARLSGQGVVSRVGPVFAANRAGCSTLAAMAVPPERLEEVACLINAYPQVNHNYERSHHFNLWFVVAAPRRDEVDAVLDDIRDRTGIEVLDLPLVADYHIDLGFDLQWN